MRAVNLLPPEEKRPSRRISGVTQVAVVSPIVVGSLLVAGYLLASSKVNDHKTTLRQLQDELSSLPTPRPQQQVDPQLAIQREQRVGALSSALQGRMAWDRVLRDISAVLPSDVWLSTLTANAATDVTNPVTGTTTTGTTGTTPPAPTGAPLNLTGYTYSQEGVARLLSRLAVVPDLQGVKLVQSTKTTVNESDVYSFTINASVRSEVTG